MSQQFYKIARTVAVPFVKMITPFKIYGQENFKNEGGIVCYANHMHTLDPIYIAAITKRYIKFLSKEENFHGILRPILNLTDALPVYRDTTLEYVRDILPDEVVVLAESEYLYKSTIREYKSVDLTKDEILNNLKAVRETIEALKNGQAVMIFPEAHRTDGYQKLLPFTHGFVVMAKKSRTPLQPIGIYEDETGISIVVDKILKYDPKEKTENIVLEAEERVKKMIGL